jgi:hypothetical protein
MEPRPFTPTRHPLVVALLVLALALVSVMPALAAPPATNDDVTNATVITAIPFTDNIDTTNATASPDDFVLCPTSGSVWYTITPEADIRLEANTFGSDYDTILTVLSGTPGSFSFVDCNDDTFGVQSRVVFNASAGTPYYFQVAKCCGFGEGDGGGDLVFSVLEGPPLLEIGVTVNPSGSVNAQTGVATVSGTVTCNAYVAFLNVSGNLRQNVGRFHTIQGSFGTTVECFAGHPAAWSATVTPESGKFGGGAAQITLSASGCDNTFFCTSAEAQASIQLRGKK